MGRKGRRRLPFGLIVVAIAAAATCLVAQAPFAFASLLRSVHDGATISTSNVQQLLPSTTSRLGSSAAVRCRTNPGTNRGASVIATWSFLPGCVLLLCAATARLAQKQGHRSLTAKVRCATAQWSVAGLDAGPLPGTVPLPVSYTQRLVPAATRAVLTPPKPAAAAAAAAAAKSTPAEPWTQHALLPEAGIMLPVVPAVAKVADSETTVHRGLSCARPALRVGTARCARRCGGIGSVTKASRLGRSRSARRAVGAWLQSKHMAQQVSQAAFDPSLLRMQVQVGLQILTQRNRSGQPRSFKLLSAFTDSMHHSRELPFSITNGNQSQRR